MLGRLILRVILLAILGTAGVPEANNILVQAWLCNLAQVLYNCINNRSDTHGGISHSVRKTFLHYQADLSGFVFE